MTCIINGLEEPQLQLQIPEPFIMILVLDPPPSQPAVSLNMQQNYTTSRDSHVAAANDLSKALRRCSRQGGARGGF